MIFSAKMNNLVRFVVALAAMLAAASCGRHYETVSGDPQNTMIYTLDNGMRIYMSVNKETPRIQTYIAVRVGSKNDPPETTGLAHYFEHLMFKGSETFGTVDYEAEKPMLDEIENLFEIYRNTSGEEERKAIYHRIDSISYEASRLAIPNEYDKLMALIGADGSNAWTSADETVYTEDIPSNQIDNWARIQADRFRNGVIRGFHTELETIYEEKNMSLASDTGKMWEALDAALFPNHPYGRQTTLGSQEHLKNPSITNVKRYREQYYVPNNIAICVSGDFEPDEMVAAIEKYFGDWEPNPSIPVLEYEEESPITEPVVRYVLGPEAESVVMGWRLPGASDLKTAAVAEIAGYLLSNGQAGLLDMDVNRQQRALYMWAGLLAQPDYSTFLVLGSPKDGQTLEDLRDIAIEEFAKLRDGDFDESLIASTINNIKLERMTQLESNSSRAQNYVNAFINGIDWKDAAGELDRLESVTREDVMAFAAEYLGENSYAVVYKRQGEDKDIQKIAAPEITPIVMNRDLSSAFLEEIRNSEVEPIEPVFVDFSRDMSSFGLADGVDVLYRRNTLNDIFRISFVFNYGSLSDPALPMAVDYLSYLGTEDMDIEEFSSMMYGLACSYSLSSNATGTTLSVSGLSENMEEALKAVENLVLNAVPDADILANIKSDMIKSRADEKKSQQACFSALSRYTRYGPEYIAATTLGNDEVMAMTPEELLGKVREVFSLGHEILYYGPMSETELKSALAVAHKLSPGAERLPEVSVPGCETPSSRVLLAQYDAKQLYYLQYSNRGEKFDPSIQAAVDLYNEYFGGGMNTVVFQEMRESRGLAYSAWARLGTPSYADGSYMYNAFIATQNDKMRQAIDAFDDIIEDMPVSEAAFSIAKDALISRMRTKRVTGYDVLSYYLSCRRLGLDEPLDREVFSRVQSMTLEDITAIQQQAVKGRKYTYSILGDIKDLDVRYLSTLGPVKVLSPEEIFGY